MLFWTLMKTAGIVTRMFLLASDRISPKALRQVRCVWAFVSFVLEVYEYQNNSKRMALYGHTRA